MQRKGHTVAYTAEKIRRMRARGEDRTDWDALDRMSEADGTMKLEDFSIGGEFLCGGRRWRCTDVGTRVVVAVCLDDHPDDPSWYNGPPYAVAESVFDEYDQEGCEPAEGEAIP